MKNVASSVRKLVQFRVSRSVEVFIPQMLYYPHYTPSKRQLRSILLFSDSIKLIVPVVDQFGVQNRSNISDIYSKTSEFIEFRDPQNRYDDWASKKV